MTMAETQRALYEAEVAATRTLPRTSYLYPGSDRVCVEGVLVKVGYNGNHTEVEATLTLIGYEDTSCLGLLTDLDWDVVEASKGFLFIQMESWSEDSFTFANEEDLQSIRLLSDVLDMSWSIAEQMMEFTAQFQSDVDVPQIECVYGVTEGLCRIANHKAVQTGGEIAILKELATFAGNREDRQVYKNQVVQYQWFIFSDRSRLEIVHNETVGTLISAHHPRHESYPNRTILSNNINGEFKCGLHPRSKKLYGGAFTRDGTRIVENETSSLICDIHSNKMEDFDYISWNMLALLRHLSLFSLKMDVEFGSGTLTEVAWQMLSHEAVQIGGEVALLEEVDGPTGTYQNQVVQYRWFIYADNSTLDFIWNDIIKMETVASPFLILSKPNRVTLQKIMLDDDLGRMYGA